VLADPRCIHHPPKRSDLAVVHGRQGPNVTSWSCSQNSALTSKLFLVLSRAAVRTLDCKVTRAAAAGATLTPRAAARAVIISALSLHWVNDLPVGGAPLGLPCPSPNPLACPLQVVSGLVLRGVGAVQNVHAVTALLVCGHEHELAAVCAAAQGLSARHQGEALPLLPQPVLGTSSARPPAVNERLWCLVHGFLFLAACKRHCLRL